MNRSYFLQFDNALHESFYDTIATMQNTIPLSQQNETAAWNRFKQGDQASFTYLHRQYYHELYFYALKIAQDEHLAKNAIQELFLYLWKNREQVSEVSSVKYYLLRSLKRHLLRLKKKEAQQQHFSSAYQETDAFTFSPEDIIIRQESEEMNQANLLRALNGLPARQREVVYLKYVNGLSNPEIAELTSLNYQSVANCLGRALDNLRKEILTRFDIGVAVSQALVLLFVL